MFSFSKLIEFLALFKARFLPPKPPLKQEQQQEQKDSLSENLRIRTRYSPIEEPSYWLKKPSSLLPSPLKGKSTLLQKTSSRTSLSTQTLSEVPNEAIAESSVLSWLGGGVVILLLLFSFYLEKNIFQEDSHLQESPEDSAPFHLHIVQKEETLWTISCFYYGSPSFWREIFLANQEELKTEASLKEGLRLLIPELILENP